MRRLAPAAVVVLALLLPAGCVMHKTSKATFCAELRRTPPLSELFGGLRADDPAALREKAQRTAKQFAKLQRAAPRQIRSQVSEVANLASKIAKAVEESPDDLTAIADAVRREAVASAGTYRATLELTSYSAKVCHYDLNDLTATSLTTLPPPSVPFVPTTG